jgi:WD40 repeat protein
MAAAPAPAALSPLELEHVVGWTGAYPTTLACHPREDTTYVCALGASVVVCDVYDPHKQRFLRGHDADVCSLDVSASGRFAASGQRRSALVATGDAAVIVWDLARGSVVYTLFGLLESVTHVAFSPDERFLAAAAADNTIAVWDVTTGEQVRPAATRGHQRGAARGAACCRAAAPPRRRARNAR